MDLPPLLLNVEDELKKFLLCPENLPIHQYEKNQEFWPRKPNPIELLHYESSPLCTTLKVHRNPNTGEITGFKEVPLPSAGATAKNSMSLNRDPAPPNEATRGNASFVPFWPGSFAMPEQKEATASNEDEQTKNELLVVPPGFDRGLIFAEDGRTLLNEKDQRKSVLPSDTPNVINLLEIVQQEQDILGAFAAKEITEKEGVATVQNETLPEEEEILKEAPVLNISTVPPQNSLKGGEWAVLLDATKPVIDFEERIPNMAIKFPFELDIFQKLAILQLEQHNHIFVAAHTSAGKTVVAEYAIALSQKHMTRTIYTSPIKALSNQKYRDFKATFKDVGLITGDFQINQTASCLIMTTEILRSMLYCGSDITRDLEYVIFDEVHYINDRERGHVWEQVLIMLPAHVCVILLSATVPNTVEFADWLGRTHQRKVYVVTTYKRPVPLQHYLYTGKGGSTRDNRFKILDADKWLMGGYIKAKESVIEKDKNVYQKMTPAQDKTLWSGLVSHLKKHDLLPVVAFTFSRQKCDNNATNLTNLDLTTQKEKTHISMFFNKCIRCLKEPDQNIPQIVTMRDILTRGIGVHHSGILPIIKEIVEMLFQKGLIKLLFATETFAMGVNMPARTVVFDSIRKHDGKEMRDLEPAEYIQMAGRAGRRGLDKEGTVLILCKLGMIPHEDNLKKMMLGKPSSLVSQFRLTYGMVLSLLRVESLSVEGMMLRSFREADHQKGMVDIRKELEIVNQQLEEISRQQISSYLQPLVKFYESASTYLQTRQGIINTIFCSPKVQKVLTPGRILVVTHKSHINKLALLLTQVRSKQMQFKVLVLNDSSSKCTDATPKEDLWYYMLGLAQDKLFQPLGTPGHEILKISPVDIFEISSKTLKTNPDLIIQDVEKRQMERFKDNPPGQTCVEVVQELHKLTMLANSKSSSANKLDFWHLITDLKVNEQGLYHQLKKIYELKDKLIDHLSSTQIPNFEQQFLNVFERKFLEERKKNLEFKLSNASLSLYPDYENRIELLRQLCYVDDQNRVQLKGRFACEIGMNELLITELVVRNILTKLSAPEVAALLSALVYRVKSRNEPIDFDSLPSDLRRGIKELTDVHQEILHKELVLAIHTDEFQEDLNFGLVHVVYEWANNKPFAEIMQLTEVQEGIIVRCIQQLNETICDIRDAARVIIGNPELQMKMEEASTAIKRDIVFAASLYTHAEGL